MKYRKKPVVIEAVQWLGSAESWEKIMAMGLTDWKLGEMGSDTFIIETSEGGMLANLGDWIIEEPFDRERKFYPCKPDIFEKTYKKEENMKTTFKRVSDIIENDEYCPIPLEVIPNNMGINLCSVEAVSWQKQEDGQLVNVSICFATE